MKILLTYSTITGNTEKVAKHIETLSKDIDVLKLENDTVVDENYDLYIVGGWIDKGTFDKKALEYAKQLKNKNVAFFFTLGAFPTSKHAVDCANNIKQVFEENGNDVLNYSFCQGPISDKLKKMMTSFPKDDPHYPNETTLRRWEIASQHPNEDDFVMFTNFYERLVKVYNDKIQ